MKTEVSWQEIGSIGATVLLFSHKYFYLLLRFNVFKLVLRIQMVIAAMKLKDAYSLEGKLWPT